MWIVSKKIQGRHGEDYWMYLSKVTLWAPSWDSDRRMALTYATKKEAKRWADLLGGQPEQA